MRRYELETEREGSAVYFFIRDIETLDIVLLPTKYLMHKIRSKCSPNTIRRSALSILYYLEYIHEKEQELIDIYQMPLCRTDRTLCKVFILAESWETYAR